MSLLCSGYSRVAKQAQVCCKASGSRWGRSGTRKPVWKALALAVALAALATTRQISISSTRALPALNPSTSTSRLSLSSARLRTLWTAERSKLRNSNEDIAPKTVSSNIRSRISTGRLKTNLPEWITINMRNKTCSAGMCHKCWTRCILKTLVVRQIRSLDQLTLSTTPMKISSRSQIRA